ncbi:uncharacterized protein LOC124142498 isoform X2 [Haliotis rufescens]|uniref:uncharacterized protein LOC124142498 isoform X2 n=1 Tax=Haliotis rufescens TaxID=6454 RepID=UPI001EAF9524|nr:uncharacterized protein LOC124142498 isoform X2 [Haliotis rufescens]
MLTAVVVVAVFSLPATLSAAHGNCSYLLTNSSDFIDSNDYMGPDPGENECFFQIQKPSGLSKDWSVQLSFSELDMEKCAECSCGYLRFVNGHVTHDMICDVAAVSLGYVYNIFMGNEVSLTFMFRSEGLPTQHHKGFALKYHVTPGRGALCEGDVCQCDDDVIPDFMGCCACNGNHSGNGSEPIPVQKSCSRIYDNNAEPDGVISNLQGNSTFVNESECYYTIKMPNISYYHGPWTVNIRFLRLDMEGCGSTCGCGYLEFLNGEVDVRRLCDFSYVDLNHTYSVNVGYDTDLKLRYHADPNYGITGFELDYEVLVGHANPCANDSCDICYYNQSIDFLGCCRCASYDISTAHIVPPTSPTPTSPTSSFYA